MRLKNLMLAGLALAAAGAKSVQAGVIYSSIPNLDVAGDAGGLLCSTCFGYYEPLDQFTLSSAETITGFKLVTGIGPAYGADDKFTIEIYNAAHNSIVFSQAVVTTAGVTTPDKLDPSHIVSGVLSGLTLPAGTYWFGAVNDHELGLGGFSFGKNKILVTFPHTGIQDPSIQGNFVSLGYQLLSSSVPESSTWTMLICGIGSIGAIARGRRRVGLS